MKQFVIREDLAQEILNYLATRPYSEVYKIIAKFQQMPNAEETQKKEESWKHQSL